MGMNQKKTAIFIVHGIGDQEPFETLDALARPFTQILEKELRQTAPKISLRKTHKLMRFPRWTDSCLSLEVPENPDRPAIDIHEYYWSHRTQRQVSAQEVWEWVISVAKGAKSFYARQKKQDGKKEKNDPLFARDGEFKNYEYLARLLSRWPLIRLIYQFLSPLFFRVEWLGKILGRALAAPVENYLGDVTIYCSTNKKSKHYKVRSAILEGACEKFMTLLKNEEYSRVVLMGHSLGSVIAYDVLSKLNRELNVDPELLPYAEKICGLVTFGSPLDKIAFFFDEQIPDHQTFRNAIISELYGFKRKNADSEALQPGLTQYFENLKWLNFWSATDPVSGHLDVYRGVINIEMDFSENISKSFKSGLESHSAYWDSAEMYKKVIEEFAICGLAAEKCEADRETSFAGKS